MQTALDSNILSSIWSAELSAPRVKQQLIQARAEGGLVICAPVYVELTAHPLVMRGVVDRLLKEAGVMVDFVVDEPIWRKTSEAFSSYAHRRRRSGGGTPKRMLTDFLIAAHASLRADRLFTLDPARYSVDFPSLRLM
ncbi:MAG TPA: type II toxin-antitoxin system VapC family toxin [Candidatus Solibacter sp.]|nr:type II toxin-antitoxin system VapC family toxin [Candidatus Solibacter sp.]